MDQRQEHQEIPQDVLMARVGTKGTPERSAYFEGKSRGYERGYEDGRIMAIAVILNTLRHDRSARIVVLGEIVQTFRGKDGLANGIVAAHGALVEQIERHGQ
jgi:hypothetical protein